MSRDPDLDPAPARGPGDGTSYRKPTAPPSMRPRRRATSPGTGAPAGPEPTAETLPGADAGWGDRQPADEDERYLADRPPHWGSD
ncbi:hypothetical protein [Klenkia taihuensis]|uniref:Uncharacterized protein n=1 Tax=Klenkia taihuensis TaxID=1225127 RepID=A0A1I1N1I5_9ACTN|nr:hypothetical protein [Klenkia taihuensis]GHE12483.1 hypothetical protein GCM10011381_30640 [Klenkia taihuensis]SFC88703.1 hypothetical protein SAMN05661030_1825 [Klenkia taihuensis]